MDPLAALPLVILFAGTDRLWGSDVRIGDRSGHSLGASLILVASVVLYFILGLPAALLAVLWIAYRSIPMFGGSGAPVNAHQYLNAVLRHILPVGYAGVISTWSDISPLRFLAAFGVYFVFAVALAIFNGATKGRNNAFVEYARGAVYGLAIAFACT